ncbi:MAG: hypothetical protein QNL00_09460 [Saprospiraceae bacterium]
MNRYNLSFALQDKDSSGVSDFEDLLRLFNPSRTLDSSDKEFKLMLYEFDNPYRVTVASFWLSDHEVTNKENRKFIDWAIVSVAIKPFHLMNLLLH